MGGITRKGVVKVRVLREVEIVMIGRVEETGWGLSGDELGKGGGGGGGEGGVKRGVVFPGEDIYNG